MTGKSPLLDLPALFHEEGVEYVLVGGQAVRLNGYLRATEDIDVVNGSSNTSPRADIREREYSRSGLRLLHMT